MTKLGIAFLAATLSGGLAAPALAAPDGKALFAGNCAACHQAAGEGIPGAFPALAKNKFVVGDPKLVAATVLNGRGGMPSFRDSLKDDELGAILSFVRTSWSNKAPPIPAATFAAVRTGKAQASRPMPVH
ncbi:cytochrome c [Sphingomonas sp. AP4-R1]|uniref:c-type cytochrome n=1 Tax=Sphingomonas sp. AP4-R1 TaxID=2735134 RepID=UPI001493D01D|nr:cytochrome c [Sphingomonas sp. AP4-R1]QJU58942.1 cytochrome c [Sphingomonas sp. AP4-R1]